MKFLAFVAASLLMPLSVSAAPLGFAASESSFTLNESEVTRTIYSRTAINPGMMVTSIDNHVQFYGADSGTQLLAGKDSQISFSENNAYHLHSGSMVISAPAFEVRLENGSVIKSASDQNMMSVNVFSEIESTIQVISGSVSVTDKDGNQVAILKELETVVLSESPEEILSTAPAQTGAPGFFPFLAQLDDEGGSAVEEDDEDRRRFFLLTPLAIAGGAAAAIGGGIIVEDEVIDDDKDDDNDDDEDEFISAINNESSEFVSQ